MTDLEVRLNEALQTRLGRDEKAELVRQVIAELRARADRLERALEALPE